MFVRKVVALIVVSKCELYALLCEITSKMCITFPLGSILSLLLFINMWDGVQGEVGALDYQSGNSQGISIHVLGWTRSHYDILSRTSKFNNRYLHLKTRASKFCICIFQIQQATARLDASLPDTRQLRTCGICFDLTVGLLRVSYSFRKV